MDQTKGYWEKVWAFLFPKELIVNDEEALLVKASKDFSNRKAGERWLVSGPCLFITRGEVHVIGYVCQTLVPDTHYAVIINPIGQDGKIKFGYREIISGPAKFFLQPGEKLENDKIVPKHILGQLDGVNVQALRDMKDGDIQRHEGDSWLIKGPRVFVPTEDIKVKDTVKAHALGEKEGIYIKDLKTGIVRIETGPKYVLLQPFEELWLKKLTLLEELAIKIGSVSMARFEKDDSYVAQLKGEKQTYFREFDYQAVVFSVPDNHVVLIRDTSDNTLRMVYGPDIVMLKPWEIVVMLELSGGTPKRPKELLVAVKALGPDFMTDEIAASTKDHTLTRIRLSYKWAFKITLDPDEDVKIYRLPDPVGYACRAMAAKIREAVANVPFEELHRDGQKIVTKAVFGESKDQFVLAENGMQIIAVDVESIEPVDPKIVSLLQEAVNTNVKIQMDITKQDATTSLTLRQLEDKQKIAQKENQVGLADAVLKQMVLAAERELEIYQAQTKNETAKVEEEKQERLKKMFGDDLAAKIIIAESYGECADKIVVVPNDSQVQVKT